MLLTEYTDKVVLQLIDKFQNENPLLTEPAIRHYIEAFEKLKGDARIIEKDITKYSFTELEEVIDANFIVRPKTDGIQMKPIYDDGIVQVYEGNNREECVLIGKGESWCIGRADASNMYNSYRYRMNEPHFYFIKDSTKLDIDGWSFFVLMPFKNGKFGLASRENRSPFTGSEQYSWNEVIDYAPVLIKLEKIFKMKPLTDEEKRIANLVKNRLSVPDLIQYFKKLSLVDHYIGWGHKLSDEQFSNLNNKELRMKYINMGHDIDDHWSLSNPEWRRYLEINRLKNNGKLTNLLSFERLTTSEIKEFLTPDRYGYDLDLSHLKSLPPGVVFPTTFINRLDLNGLISLPPGVVFPKTINFLFLERLTSLPPDIVFPETIMNLYLRSIESFPKKLYDTLTNQVKDKIPKGVVR
jgi:hypothetical protein